MLKTVTLSGLVSCAAVRPASAFWINHADGTYTFIPGGLVPILLLAGLVIVSAAFVSVGSSYQSRQKTANEYNEEATMLAAKRYRVEMETELRKAEIEAARISALHQETSDIIAHDKQIRELNAKLEEIRRRS